MRIQLLAVIALAGVNLFAQAGANPLVGDAKGVFDRAKDVILRSADKMPESDFAFRPNDQVRTFGEILNHIAGAQYMFCGAAGSGKPERRQITAKTKAELQTALKDAFAYCDAVYAKLSDAEAAGTVKFFGRDMTKLGVLNFNNAHDYEHYGNLVTYLRIKNIVPPSSEKR